MFASCRTCFAAKHRMTPLTHFRVSELTLQVTLWRIYC